MTAIKNRYDFLYLFDVKNGNPNGDPDNDNAPRTNSQGFGLTTDVMIKRKLRNYVALTKEGEAGYEIFVKEAAVLNQAIAAAHEAVGSTSTKVKKEAGADKLAQAYLCKTFYDIRAFGAVLTTGDKGAGAVRGPMQFTFSESIDPIQTGEHCLTRCAVTDDKDLKDLNDSNKKRTIGRKTTVEYGLYKGHGFVNANLATKSGFSQEDLTLTFQGLVNMFEHDRSAARGLMSTRRVIVFEHSNELGDASAVSLFERVKVTLKAGVTEPTCFDDYEISINTEGLPSGIRVLEVSISGELIENR